MKASTKRNILKQIRNSEQREAIASLIDEGQEGRDIAYQAVLRLKKYDRILPEVVPLAEEAAATVAKLLKGLRQIESAVFKDDAVGSFVQEYMWMVEATPSMTDDLYILNEIRELENSLKNAISETSKAIQVLSEVANLAEDDE